MAPPEPSKEELARELALLRQAQAHIPPPKPGGDPSKVGGTTLKRTLVLWVLFVLAFVAIWQYVSPEGGGQGPAPTTPVR